MNRVTVLLITFLIVLTGISHSDPAIQSGKTVFLPLRHVVQWLGGEVDANRSSPGPTQIVIRLNGKTTEILPQYGNGYSISGIDVVIGKRRLHYPSYNAWGYYLPVDFFTKELGIPVSVDVKQQKVYITEPETKECLTIFIGDQTENWYDADPAQAFESAMFGGDIIKASQLLLWKPRLVNGHGGMMRAPLILYSNRDLATVQLMVRGGANVNAAEGFFYTTALDYVNYTGLKPAQQVKEYLMANGARPNYEPHISPTPTPVSKTLFWTNYRLHRAARTGNLPMLEKLLKAGASLEGWGTWTPLHEAIEHNQREMLLFLLKKGAKVTTLDWTPLHEAAYVGNLFAAKELVKHGADVKAKNLKAQTPLHLAALNGNTEIIRLLIHKGAVIQAADTNGVTPLFEAAGMGNREATTMLLRAGAKCNVVNNLQETPLHWAARTGNTYTVSLLLNAGAKVNAVEKIFGDTPFHFAIVSRNIFSARILLNHGAKINMPDKDGGTPLIEAANAGNKQLIIFLLRAGAKCNVHNMNQETPLLTAVTGGHKHAVLLLLHAGAHVNTAGFDGNTPLHIAAQYGYLSIVRILLDHGAKINIHNQQGETPLDIAGGPYQDKMIKFLRERGAK